MRLQVAHTLAMALSLTVLGGCRLGVAETNRFPVGDGGGSTPATAGSSASGASGGASGSGAAGEGGISARDSGGEAGASVAGPLHDAGDDSGMFGTGGTSPGGSGGMTDASSGGRGGISGMGSGGSAGGSAARVDCTHERVHSHAEHDYYFCSNYLSWTAARDSCAGAAGGSLVVIDDDAENAFLTTQFGPHPSWWIGANDESMPDEWRWVDGASNDGASFCTGNHACTPVGGAYVNFALGEPNAVSIEGCAAIQSAGTWADEYCVVSKPFICEVAP